ncbi:hypothetical protein ACFQMM_11075 [Saliphagus sp. GCM10025308]
MDVDLTDPVGTDRRAVADGEVSITPLFVDHRTPELDVLESLASGYSSDGEGRRWRFDRSPDPRKKCYRKYSDTARDRALEPVIQATRP